MVLTEVVSMRVEFHQGVPEGCIAWLWDNVGRGNITNIEDGGDYDWFYSRITLPVPLGSNEPRYVPVITVKDPKLAMLFVLRWSS
jgi:hypothetical protein